MANDDWHFPTRGKGNFRVVPGASGPSPDSESLRVTNVSNAVNYALLPGDRPFPQRIEGSASCRACGHQWRAVIIATANPFELQCPACSKFEGYIEPMGLPVEIVFRSYEQLRHVRREVLTAAEEKALGHIAAALKLGRPYDVIEIHDWLNISATAVLKRYDRHLRNAIFVAMPAVTRGWVVRKFAAVRMPDVWWEITDAGRAAAAALLDPDAS